MRALLVALGCLAAGLQAPLAAQEGVFDRAFLPRTLRVDYHHGGTATAEFFALSAVREEPVWGGPRTRLVDDLDRGSYRVGVFDAESGRLLYSRGYTTVFREWQTTAEARTERRVFAESVSLPYPRRPVRITLASRDRRNVLHERFSCHLDPAAATVRRDPPRRDLRLVKLVEHGPPAAKVDLAIVAEGYTAAELDRFETDARRLLRHLFSIEPFRSRERDFNVTLVGAASQASGIDEPDAGRFRRTAAEASFRALGLARYVLIEDYPRLRDLVAGVAVDRLIVLVNSDRYGGGGLYNWFVTVTARNPWSGYILVHEFGHNLAGLADEYYTSSVSYENFYPAGVEPLAPNLTRLLEPSHLKWKDLVRAGTPLPTPWPKDDYEELAAAQRARLARGGQSPEERLRLEKEQGRARRRLLAPSPYAGQVGAFEGGGYAASGVYRPSLDCLMFSKSASGFCPVCRRALAQTIDRLVR